LAYPCFFGKDAQKFDKLFLKIPWDEVAILLIFILL